MSGEHTGVREIIRSYGKRAFLYGNTKAADADVKRATRKMIFQQITRFRLPMTEQTMQEYGDPVQDML